MPFRMLQLVSAEEYAEILAIRYKSTDKALDYAVPRWNRAVAKNTATVKFWREVVESLRRNRVVRP